MKVQVCVRVGMHVLSRSGRSSRTSRHLEAQHGILSHGSQSLSMQTMLQSQLIRA
jgi:hypothetical protein